MKRRDSIRTLLASMWVTVLPQWAATGAQDNKTLYTGFIAGYQYADGPAHEAALQPGDRLHLQREPGNEHDHRAIAIYWDGVKLGYLPRHHNLVLKNMVDQGMPLHARIQSIDRQAEPWERVTVEVVMGWNM